MIVDEIEWERRYLSDAVEFKYPYRHSWTTSINGAIFAIIPSVTGVVYHVWELNDYSDLYNAFCPDRKYMGFADTPELAAKKCVERYTYHKLLKNLDSPTED